MATLGTQFSQNVLADEKAYTLVLETKEDLAGLPEFLVNAAAEAAEERGMAGKHVITLSRSSIEPFLQFSKRRDLRETAWRAWLSRGEHEGPTDNRGIAAEMVALRAERAQLLGFDSFADFRLDDSMAKTPQNALDLLHSVWTPARAKAEHEEQALQSIIQSEGGNFETAPWDWRHYAEKRRKAEFDLDESEIKPYLQLDKMIEAAFDTASRLFGLKFTERNDIAGLSPRRARMGSHRRGWPARRPFSRRLFRAAFKAQRRLDERLPLAGKARGRHSADHRQRDEFRQGRRMARRCSALTTHARFSTNSGTRCTGCCRT